MLNARSLSLSAPTAFCSWKSQQRVIEPLPMPNPGHTTTCPPAPTSPAAIDWPNPLPPSHHTHTKHTLALHTHPTSPPSPSSQPSSSPCASPRAWPPSWPPACSQPASQPWRTRSTAKNGKNGIGSLEIKHRKTKSITRLLSSESNGLLHWPVSQGNSSGIQGRFEKVQVSQPNTRPQ